MLSDHADTIAAIATGVNQGGIGIIRVSGDQAISIVDSVFVPNHKGKEVSNLATYTAAYGTIRDEEQRILDEVIVLVMKAPASYTKEDVVEIDCHGGSQVMRQILRLLLRRGVRAAQPGEFTKRAFLNGRIDLSQAESIMDLISAKSEMAASAAMSQLRGNLREKIEKLRRILIRKTAFIESALDDPEHYSLERFPEELDASLVEIEEEIRHLLDTAEDGRRIREGVRTVILGKPNAGKSSVLNVLTGKDRAIVTEIAGTTRDTLEEWISVSGIPLNVIDTAGIRQTEDVVEKIGVDKSFGEMEQADLILYIVDSSLPLDENDLRIMEAVQDKQVIILFNKTDLACSVEQKEILSRLNKPFLEISAKEQTGFEAFYALLKEMFFHGKLSYNDEWIVTNVRQQQALLDALASVDLVRNSIADGMPEDFYTIDLMEAYEALGRIIGEALEEDLVDTIFREFCMGK